MTIAFRVGAALVLAGLTCSACGGSEDTSEDPGWPRHGTSLEEVSLPRSIENGALINSTDAANAPAGTNVDGPDLADNTVVYVDPNLPFGEAIEAGPVVLSLAEGTSVGPDELADAHLQHLAEGNTFCWEPQEGENFSDPDASFECLTQIDGGIFSTGFQDVAESPVTLPADLEEAMARHEDYLEQNSR